MDASSFAISDANTREGVDPRAPLSLIFRVEARESERDGRTTSEAEKRADKGERAEAGSSSSSNTRSKVGLALGERGDERVNDVPFERTNERTNLSLDEPPHISLP